MANILPEAKQVAILNCLTEGVSVRATERLLDVSRETVLSLLVRAGEGCERLQKELLVDLDCDRIEVDEIWAFVSKKQRYVTDEDNRAEVGDAWTYVAIDPVSKLVPCFLVGKRDGENTNAFIADLASRMRNKVQVSSDGLSLYVNAVERAFGSAVNYGQIVKAFEADSIGTGRYSPPKVTAVEKTVIIGRPDPDKICTSIVERQNLTMRMQIRRMTRLTNAFSKKLRNHRAATSLHFAAYNLVRTHGTIRVTPAMAAGVTNRIWTMTDLLNASLHGERP